MHFNADVNSVLAGAIVALLTTYLPLWRLVLLCSRSGLSRGEVTGLFALDHFDPAELGRLAVPSILHARAIAVRLNSARLLPLACNSTTAAASPSHLRGAVVLVTLASDFGDMLLLLGSGGRCPDPRL